MDLHTLYNKNSSGRYGTFQLEIKVGGTVLPNLQIKSIYDAAYDAVEKIEDAIMTEIIKNNPEAQERARIEKSKIISLFPGEPFVEEIPNGYCSRHCCKHLPWFIVTTQVGRIKIGWRKSVIAIDWSETHRTKNSDELFAAENVTKEDRMIHAWSYDKAREYIKAIIESEV